MWQIPCKMTNSSSKPLQTLGKWYQPRNPKKIPNLLKKKFLKLFHTPFQPAQHFPTFPNQSVDNGTIWNVSPGILRRSGAQTVDLAKSDIFFATEMCSTGSDYIWLTSPEAASRAARHQRWSLGYGMILCCVTTVLLWILPCQAGTDGDAQTSPLIRKAKQEDSRESPQAMMGHVSLQSRSRNCRKWKLRTTVNENMRINRSEPVSSNIKYSI